MVPLANQLHSICKQVWFADDKVHALRKWWDLLLEKGSSYGYFPKAAKTWLIVKEDKLEAKHIFKDTGVKITSDGMRHLGAAIGSKDFKDSYVLQKIQGMDRQRRATGQNCNYGATSSLFSLH